MIMQILGKRVPRKMVRIEQKGLPKDVFAGKKLT